MWYYASAIFISAFLLFQIQPLISKYILPWFGGTPAVWSASMLFFQVVLTGGYAYAYWLIKRRTPRWQGLIHFGLLFISLGWLAVNAWAWGSPIFPNASWRPQSVGQPVWDVLSVLGVAVGLPYFLLATNSTLMQAWFTQEHPTKSPYTLYALSNIGSFIGLISYPIFFEPLFPLSTQGLVWSGGYTVFAILLALQALKGWRIVHPDNLSTQTNSSKPPTPTLLEFGLWILLAACASVMLLASTNQLTQEVAVIPFLWVLPLVIYLLSFILTFSSERWYQRNIFFPLLALSSFGYFVILILWRTNFLALITIHLILLFTLTMCCHGELFRLRPAPNHLTSFYLMVSIGGAVGGIAVNFVAPYIFNGYWEFQLGLSAVWLLLMGVLIRYPQPYSPREVRLILPGFLTMILMLGGFLYFSVNAFSQNSIWAERNFYGVVKVTEEEKDNPQSHRYIMSHGVTIHGSQYVEEAQRTLPTSYYSEDSGVGLALRYIPSNKNPIRVGVLGLGAGTLATYGRPGDVFRFYEINPAVISIAQGQYFSYLKDSPAQIEIVAGDARLSLEHELTVSGTQNYDLLVLDTFSSDSIPTHLLTREAFALYLKHLKPQGVLALHISNRYLDLSPVVWQLADNFNLKGASFKNDNTTNKRASPALWILLTYHTDFLQNPPVLSQSTPHPETLPQLRLWTDDYSNLFQILR